MKTIPINFGYILPSGKLNIAIENCDFLGVPPINSMVIWWLSMFFWDCLPGRVGYFWSWNPKIFIPRFRSFWGASLHRRRGCPVVRKKSQKCETYWKDGTCNNDDFSWFLMIFDRKILRNIVVRTLFLRLDILYIYCNIFLHLCKSKKHK